MWGIFIKKIFWKFLQKQIITALYHIIRLIKVFQINFKDKKYYWEKREKTRLVKAEKSAVIENHIIDGLLKRKSFYKKMEHFY